MSTSEYRLEMNWHRGIIIRQNLLIHLNDVNETNYNETYGGGSSGAPALSRIVRSNSACSLGVIDTEADVLLPLACAMMTASGITVINKLTLIVQHDH